LVCNNSISVLENVKSNIIYRKFVFIWTGLPEFHVKFSGLEQKSKKDAEENFSSLFNIGIEAMNRLFQSPAAESVEAYKQSSTEADRKCHRDRVKTELMTILNQYNVSKRKIPLVAETFTETTLEGIEVEKTDPTNSIKVCCRCRTEEALYGLKQLIDSGKMADHFSLIMRCLISEQVTAIVIMSEKDFNKCFKSLTDAAG